MFPAEARNSEIVENIAQSWKSGKVNHEITNKVNARVVSRIAEQFKTSSVRKWGDFKAVYLSSHWLNACGTLGFDFLLVYLDL